MDTLIRGYIGRNPFNQNSNWSDWEKWSISKGGPVFSKLFRLDRTDPLSFGPKFPEILVEWIAPIVTEYSGVYSCIFLFLGVAFKWQGILQLSQNLSL